MRHSAIAVALLLVASAGTVPSAYADSPFDPTTWQACGEESARVNPWAVQWALPSAPESLAFTTIADSAVSFDAASDEDQTARRRRPVAVEYSDAYKTRNKIHKLASYATLPLFATEYWLGAYMYAYPNSITSGLQTAHRTVGISLGALFGINTVTGVWNLWEGRKDPNHRTRRMAHGISMLVADAGFALAGLMRPKYPINQVDTYYNQRMVHRAIATTSMVIAGASYLMMLFGGN